MKLRINNWKKYQQRTSGYKNCWWFSLSNKFLEDPEIWELTNAEKVAYIYILCLASQANKDEITVSVRHAEKSSDVKVKDLNGAIKKLEHFKVVTVIRPASVQDSSSICPVHNITRQDITEQDKTTLVDSASTRGHWLVELWNDYCGVLPKVRLPISSKRLKGTQSRVKETSDRALWLEGISRLAESDFASGGGSTSWVASYDWLIKPDNLEKVLEGKYDNRKSLKTISKNAHLLKGDYEND